MLQYRNYNKSSSCNKGGNKTKVKAKLHYDFTENFKMENIGFVFFILHNLPLEATAMMELNCNGFPKSRSEDLFFSRLHEGIRGPSQVKDGDLVSI